MAEKKGHLFLACVKIRPNCGSILYMFLRNLLAGCRLGHECRALVHWYFLFYILHYMLFILIQEQRKKDGIFSERQLGVGVGVLVFHFMESLTIRKQIYWIVP